LYGTTVFPTYFKYKNTISSVLRTSYASDSDWMQVFKNEVQNGRPSQLRIRDPNAGGHSIVVDGYRDSPSEQIHLNMGWSGSYNGWYVPNGISAGGYNFSDVSYQGAVIGIEPSSRPCMAADFDGDVKTDIAIYRGSAWYIKPSSGAATYAVNWGGDASDIPVPGDYDGEKKVDIAVYRKSNGVWYIRPSSGTTPYAVSWGGDASDIPVPGNYVGDVKTDIAIYRKSSGVWFIVPSTGVAPYAVSWGGDASDIPVPGNYDADTKTDIAVYRKSNGLWFVVPSTGAAPYAESWGGMASDVPITYNRASY
jgi:hypothetical protein